MKKVLAIAATLTLGVASAAFAQTTGTTKTAEAPKRTCAGYYLPYGKLQMANRQYEAAAFMFRYCVLLEPKNAEALYLLGRSEASLDLYTAAIDHLSEAIKIDSRMAPAYVAMAQAYTEQYRTASDKKAVATALDKALQYLDDGERIASKNADKALVYNQRGIIYSYRGDYDKAEAAYRSGIKLNPEASVIHANLGALLIRVNQPDAAARALTDAIEADPSDYVTRATLAKVLLSKGDVTGGKSQATQAYRTNSDAKRHPFVVGQYGIALYLAKDLDGAKTMLESATKLQSAPLYAENYYYLGRVYLDRGDAKGARGAFTKATAVPSGSAESLYWYWLGRANVASGLKDEAKASYTKALALKPGYKEAQDGLNSIK